MEVELQNRKSHLHQILTMKPRLARFQHTYTIGPRTYQTVIPAISSAHARRQWDRPGAKLIRVEEVDKNGLTCP